MTQALSLEDLLADFEVENFEKGATIICPPTLRGYNMIWKHWENSKINPNKSNGWTTITLSISRILSKLSNAEEKTLVRWISRLTATGYPATPGLLKEMAQEILNQRVIFASSSTPPSFQSNHIGQRWIYRFLDRYPKLKGTYSRKLESARHKEATFETISAWYSTFQARIEERHYELKNIYNMDEIGYAVGETESTRIIVDSTLKSNWKVTAGKQEWITVLECVNADGGSLPPMIIFKAQNTNTAWIPTNTPPNCSPPNDIELRQANKVFNSALSANNLPTSPVQRYAKRITHQIESLNAENAILRKELQEYKELLETRKKRKNGKRIKLKGEFVFSTEEVLKIIEEAEQTPLPKRRRGRPSKRQIDQVEEEMEEEEDSDSSVGSVIVVDHPSSHVMLAKERSGLLSKRLSIKTLIQYSIRFKSVYERKHNEELESMQELRTSSKKPGFEYKNPPKPIASLNDLQDILGYLWMNDPLNFLYERARVQIALLILILVYTASRPGALIESHAYYMTGQSMRYKDIKFTLQQNPNGGRPLMSILFTFNLRKNERDDEGEVYKQQLFEDLTSRDMCPITHCFLLWLLPTMRLKPFNHSLRKVAQRAGFKDIFTSYVIRRTSANVLNQHVTSAERGKILGHSNDKVFQNSYLASHSGIDLQSLTVGQEQRTQQINFARSLNSNRGTPLGLITKEFVEVVAKDPEITVAKKRVEDARIEGCEMKIKVKSKDYATREREVVKKTCTGNAF
ncbi:hypothetical protein DID88_000727 [Monilinia fructigena]|uniref:HTH CENPB-type domain-containing protein n=1 Tax=Monilinia fructigena TaxID=38457 RepID=A0A395IID1_9HELO|nr:hypothetical protein DID88_000727 [Monilinia fructigena]